MKFPDEIEETCKKLKPVIGEKADNLWYSYLAENEKGRRELALDIEIIAEKFLKKTALEKKSILLEPPSVEDSKGEFLLGDAVYNDKKLHPLYLRPEDFIKQVGIFAITGEGKTNLAYLLALQLLKSKTPFIVIDWKRSWRNLLSLKDKIPELKQVQVFTIGRDVLPFLWNPFRQPPNADKELWINTVAEALEKSHLSGPGVAYYLNRIYSKLFRGLPKDFYPNFFDGLEELGKIKAIQRELKWKQTALRIFQSFTLGNTAKTFNARNPIKFEELLEKPVILELDLEMPKPLRVFFSEMILRWIHLYRLGQGETESLRHVLFLEEAHNLFTENRFYKETNNSLENVYREIRAFGQGIVSITQHPSLLPIYLLGNCHTQIYLGLQHSDDIRTARKALFMKQDEEAYPNMLRVGECITKIKNRIEPCLVRVPLVPVKKGFVDDRWLKIHNLGYQFWKYGKGFGKNLSNTPGCLKTQFARNTPVSSLNSGKNISKQASKLADISKDKKSEYPRNNGIHHKLLEDVFLNPFSGITRRYKKLKLNTHYGNNLKNRLVKQRCIVPRKIVTKKGWITLFDITQKGRMVLRDLGHEVKNTREGIVHRFWKERIAEHYRSKNLEVLVEEPINGRADIIVKGNGKKIAVEIETGKSDFILNIQKALKAGFDEVICVATSKKVEEKIREEIARKGIVDERVRVRGVLGFGWSGFFYRVREKIDGNIRNNVVESGGD